MNNFIKEIRYFIRKISASRVGAYSAQTAFFMFLSLIPLVMLLLSLVRQLGTSAEEVSNIASEYAPGFLGSFFETYIDEIITNGRLSMTVVSSVILLWSASRGIYAIIGGLNSVYEIKEERNYFLIRLLAVFYTVAFIIILVGALLLLVFGNEINALIYSIFPNLKGLVYIISSLRFILGFVILILFFSIMYKSLPNRKMKFIDQIPGAVITSAGWVSFSILFSFFVDNFSNYANIYGSLTAIIVLMLWLYICMYIMFIGAELNCILSSKIYSQQETD
ncbi:MAG: YihY/virulence factor BrkB family protein [Clostridia bacterium]|nr:YihY/virulence factor BrkB family protein [Clostridia bacterium]